MSGAFNNAVIKLDDNPIAVFYSGQVISGSLLFDLDQPKTISALYIQFLGEAKVLWTEDETETVNGMTRNKTVKYSGREEYFNFSQPLAGGVGPSQLPAGSQSFPFRFQIPFTCPSSFNGEQGQVSYSMTAYLVYPEPTLSQEELRKHFEVIAPFDLNSGSPRIRQPIDLEFEEVYGCDCFCSPDPVTIRIRLPVSGYCPGQHIPVHVEVDNESSVEITKMIFQITTKERYRSQHPSSEYIPPEKVLLTVKYGAVLAHSKRSFTADVPVPEILPPYLENCGIIDVGYFFRTTIKLSGCNEKLQDESEICLGLVPIREITNDEYKHPFASCLPPGPIPTPGPELMVPPTNLTGSNTSLNRVQYNNVQSSYTTNPPYPSQNVPYPTGNSYQTSMSVEIKSQHVIGFKAPEAGYPYPGNVPSVIPPPYPAANLAPYPTNNASPQINTGSFAPSAPPPQ